MRDRRRPLAVPGRRQRVLLALLLLHQPEPLASDRLIEELWGEEPPATAKTSLQAGVSRLRKLLGPELVLTLPAGYALQIAPDQLDLARFQRLAAEARAAAAEQRARALRAALSLWRGPPLADFAYEPFAQGEIARLEELRLACLEERIEAELALGEDGALVSELQELIAQHPLRERLRGQLMLALYRAGRQAEALAAYRQARATLLEELGLEPSPGLKRLEQAILRQQQELAAAASAVVLPAPVLPRPQRKTVTVLFADLVGSTSLAERIDAELLERVMAQYFQRARAVLERHGGTVEKFIGDAAVAVFGVPRLHEDDALRAVRAASELQQALAALNEELERDFGLSLALRVGINTGEVVAHDPASGKPAATGAAVNLAARLEQAAAPGEILLSEETHALVAQAVRAEPLAPLAVKGKREPVSALRLRSLLPAPAAPRLEAGFVGRAGELRWLRQAFERALADRSCLLALVLGEAGIGKSRLAQEFLARLEGEASVLRGRCLSYGEGITFLPLAEAVRQAAGIDDRSSPEQMRARLARLSRGLAPQVPALIGALLGVEGQAGSLEETFWAVRTLLEALARRRPLVLLLEDLHWAEPTLLELVEHLRERTREAPLLLLCLARPELLEERGELGATQLLLEPLAREEAERLLENLPGAATLTPPARGRLQEAAQGNPLFLEQLVAFARERGEAELAVPPTIQALLAARLERLGPGERAVLEAVAIAGSEVSQSAIVELLPAEARGTAAPHLRALVRRELLRPSAAPLFGEDAVGFRHVLIREAAYRPIPKGERAQLHERYADWLEESAGERVPEYEEILGYHLEQAYRYREELGSVDERSRALAERAGERLGSAGRRALEERGDNVAAPNLLGRALVLLPDGNPARPELLRFMAQAVVDPRAAASFARQAVDAAVALGDRSAEWRARLIEIGKRSTIDSTVTLADLTRTADSALQVFHELGDDRGCVIAWVAIGIARQEGGQSTAAGEAFARAQEYRRRARLSEEPMFLHWTGVLHGGATPVDEAYKRITELLGRTERLPVRAPLLAYLGWLDAMRGRFSMARELCDQGIALFDELGDSRMRGIYAQLEGCIERLAGRPSVAEGKLRNGYQILVELGETSRRCTTAGMLADAVYAQGRLEEAERFAKIGEQLSAIDDVDARSLSLAVRAKVAARRGSFDEAERLGRAGMKLLEPTDWLNSQADARVALAEVLALAGRRDDAIAMLEEAIALYKRKGNVVSEGSARSLVGELTLA